MSDRLVELPDLRRILLEGAGAVQGVDLNGEILDSSFEDLGYDSIAIMETAARISREYGVDPLERHHVDEVMIWLVEGIDWITYWRERDDGIVARHGLH